MCVRVGELASVDPACLFGALLSPHILVLPCMTKAHQRLTCTQGGVAYIVVRQLAQHTQRGDEVRNAPRVVRVELPHRVFGCLRFGLRFALVFEQRQSSVGGARSTRASLPRPMFGEMCYQRHDAHRALSHARTHVDQRGDVAALTLSQVVGAFQLWLAVDCARARAGLTRRRDNYRRSTH